tara:strand:+ start:72 stop:368 length:297 start_codon:yes stop_codon:yes gene_type:complete
MKYAIIKNNTVENIINWDGQSELNVDGDLILCDENSYIGGRYENGFVPREIPPPKEIPYDRLRKHEYPSIEECVHAILDDQLDALQVKRQAIKAKYPK